MEKQIPVFSNSGLKNNSTFAVYTPSKKRIENPVNLSVFVNSDEPDGGIMVPYGGYLSIAVNKGAYIDMYVLGSNTIRLSGGSSYFIKIVEPIVLKVIPATNEA